MGCAAPAVQQGANRNWDPMEPSRVFMQSRKGNNLGRGDFSSRSAQTLYLYVLSGTAEEKAAWFRS